MKEKYGTMKVSELKSEIKRRNIPNTSQLNKANLVKVLEENDLGKSKLPEKSKYKPQKMSLSDIIELCKFNNIFGYENLHD